MRNLFYMFIGLGLLVSCSNNPDDGFPEPQYDASNGQGNESYPGESYAGNESVNASLLGEAYNVSWVIDRQEVDTATLSVGDIPEHWHISHFPMTYFLNLVGKKVEPTEINYTQDKSSWILNCSVVIGYSANNAYLQNSNWAPRVWFQVNGEDYSFQIYMYKGDAITLNNQTSLMYDMMNDMWSGATPVYRFELINHKTNENWDQSFDTPINMSFQTTGRKE